MTIDWGSYHVVGGTGLRVGIQDEGQSAVTNASSTCVQSFTDWSNPGGAGATGSNYNGDAVTVSQSATGGALDDDSFASVVDGSANGSSGPQNEQHGGTHTLTWTYSDYGTAHTVDVTIGITGTFNGSAPTKTKTFTIPARPYSVPSAPTSPTATRISDTQVDLAWSNNSTASGLYQSVKVYRSTDGGSYALITTLGVVTSYSDTTTSANHKYQYKIEAVNTAGATQSAATTAVYTTPGTPTIGTATKLGSGNIELSFTPNIGYGDTTYGTDIYESQNGGAFSYVASVSGGLTTWEHVAPSTSVTHAYKVLHTKGALFSSLSGASNTVTLLSTAGAPTGLSPSGVARDATGSIVLSWTHNPTDGTPQSKRRVQAKVNAGSYADLVNDTNATSSYTVTGGTWSNGDTITWKAATAGENGTLGSYSAESSFTLSAKPTATISTPASIYASSTLTVEWAYFQAQSSAQATWVARLYDADMVLLESLSGTTELTATFATTVSDGASYTVTVTVTSAAGVESDADSQAFDVVYTLPADITVAGVFDASTGFISLTLTGDAAEQAVAALELDGSGDYASTPDAAALDLTGDFDIACDVYTADWTPAAVSVWVSKWNTSNQSFYVGLHNTGVLTVAIDTTGSGGTVFAASSTAPTPVNDRLSLRFRRVSGVMTFYTSTDTDLATASWSQLGTTQALAGTIFSGTAALRVGDTQTSAAPFNGRIYSVLVKNAADTTVANPDFSAQPGGTTTFADGAGLTWTLGGDAEIVELVEGTEAIVSVDVQRQINGGDWLTILTGVVLDGGTLTALVSDTVPITVGTNTYRAIAYSALPSSRMSAEDDVVTTETTWGYLSGGTSFGTVARFKAMPTFTPSVSRAKALYSFAGRADPVQLTGDALSLSVGIAGKLTSDSGTAADFEALGQAEGVHCWRGPDGRRVFGSIGKVDTPRSRLRVGGNVAFTITKLDFTEGDQ